MKTYRVSVTYLPETRMGLIFTTTEIVPKTMGNNLLMWVSDAGKIFVANETYILYIEITEAQP